MIKLTKKNLGIYTAIAAIGVGGAALPSAALAAPAHSHTAVVKTDRSKDKPGVPDTSRNDRTVDNGDRSST